MPNLVDFLHLKEYDLLLKEVGSIRANQTVYNLNDTVTFKGLNLKCTVAGMTGTDDISVEDVNIGDTIEDGSVTWTVYNPFEGKSITDWKGETDYLKNDLVVINNALYRCLNAHTSSTEFADDTVYWQMVGVSVENGYGYSQVQATDVVANTYIYLPIDQSSQFVKPPVEVLKADSATTGTSITSGFVPKQWDYDTDNVEMSYSSVKMRNSYEVKTSSPVLLSTKYIQESEEIDLSNYADVGVISVD